MSDEVSEYDLPPNPEQTFFHGQYDKLNEFVLKDLLKIEELGVTGKKFKLLDIDPGVNSSGSPVTQDLTESLAGFDATVEATVLEEGRSGMLDDGNTKYIDKVEDLPSDTQFDLLRLFYFGNDLTPTSWDQRSQLAEEYKKRRNQIVSRLKEGGLFIALQEMMGWGGRDSFGDRREISFNPFIKIMQKRDGVLSPVALFPASYLPLFHHDDQDLFDFQKANSYRKAYDIFRQKVQKKEVLIPAGSLDQEGFENSMKALEHAQPNMLDFEKVDFLTGVPDRFDMNNQGAEIFKTMDENRKDVAERFMATLN